MHKVIEYLADESGQGMVEYALITALIALVVVGALTAMGDVIRGQLEGVQDGLVA